MANNFFQQRASVINDTGPRGTTFYGITAGRVVSTNDPQQMGRLYVLCPELGDPSDLPAAAIESLPICSYLAPFGGSTPSTFARGPEDETYTTGAVTYGMWNIPKLGAIVAVMCLDGDPNQRVWVGSLYDQFVTNSLPHGRFLYEDEKGKSPEGTPDGPFSSTEAPIQPLYANQTKAFTSRLKNFEWRTRGADYQNTAIIGYENYMASPCLVKDDKDVTVTQEDGTELNITTGTDDDRGTTHVNDNHVYSWTTPGFHSISMDDRMKNCRMRLRTTAGHQIILDDTNERIYINTCKGNNWIEIDEDGCIDIFSTEKISATAKHINLTAEETMRLYGKQGVHIKSDTEIRIQAGTNMHTTVGQNIDIEAGQHIRTNSGTNYDLTVGTTFATYVTSNYDVKVGGNIQTHSTGNNHTVSDGNIHTQSAGNSSNLVGGNVFVQSSANYNVLAGGNVNTQSSGSNNTLAGGNIVETAAEIQMNGPQAASAAAASAANPANKAIPAAPEPSFWTNRYPNHEPWGRVSTKTDFTHEPRYVYNDPLVGREHKARGSYWRR